MASDTHTWKGSVRRENDLAVRSAKIGIEVLEKAREAEQRSGHEGLLHEADNGGPLVRLSLAIAY
jgi:hypothetical protein